MMLTETVSDPRRANWLTLSSMSDDISWPEETNISRPSWELEAEILRLTTRLMMRETELKQVKNQLKCQTTKAQQQAILWKQRMDEKDEQMRILLVQKDAEMQSIVSQLLLFEAELRKEQARIEDLLSEKDAQITFQQQEIEQLKKCLDSKKHNNNNNEENRTKSTVSLLANNATDSSKLSKYIISSNSDKNLTKFNKYLSQEPVIFEDVPVIDTREAVCKLKNGLLKIRAIQDVTNVKSLDTTKDCVFLDKKKVPTKAPQKMKDLKAKRINQHKVHRGVMSEFTGQTVL